MKILENLRKFWKFLKEDSWQSWIVSLILMVLFIKLIFFPLLSLLTGTSLPLLVVESCSMYHSSSFETWWSANGAWYEQKGINKTDFINYNFKNGLNKGDIIFVTEVNQLKKGQVIIFQPNQDSLAKHPIIHRIIYLNQTQTKGDNNQEQLTLNNNILKVDETSIPKENIMGKAVFKIPALGWVKLIFFEPLRPENERGFCKSS